jgi:hypothetical protein
MNKADLAFKTNNDIMLFYQTSFRNVGLTTAVSFAALAYSRFYRSKSLMYSVGLVFVSIVTILCSVIFNCNLYNSVIRHHSINKKLYAANKYLIINKLFMVNHMIIMFFAIYTLYRLITDNQFS